MAPVEDPSAVEQVHIKERHTTITSNGPMRSLQHCTSLSHRAECWPEGEVHAKAQHAGPDIVVKIEEIAYLASGGQLHRFYV